MGSSLHLSSFNTPSLDSKRCLFLTLYQQMIYTTNLSNY